MDADRHGFGDRDIGSLDASASKKLRVAKTKAQIQPFAPKAKMTSRKSATGGGLSNPGAKSRSGRKEIQSKAISEDNGRGSSNIIAEIPKRNKKGQLVFPDFPGKPCIYLIMPPSTLVRWRIDTQLSAYPRRG